MTYVVSYSFSNWQAANPSKPLPAAELDAELAAIAAVTAGLEISLAAVRRSDGKLQNEIVTYDSLDAQVRALLAPTRSVTAPDIASAAFAGVAEAEAGVSTDKIMTPARTKEAVAAQRPFASQVEAEAASGQSNTAVMTPLRGAQQIGALRPYATQAQAEALSSQSAAAVMTPLRGAQQIGALRRAATATAAVTFGAIGAGASASQAVTVAGALVGDGVIVGLPAAGIDAGVLVTAWVSGANTVTIRATNITSGSITPAAGMSIRLTAVGF